MCHVPSWNSYQRTVQYFIFDVWCRVGVYFVHVNLTNKLGTTIITKKIFVVDAPCQVPEIAIINDKNLLIMVGISSWKILYSIHGIAAIPISTYFLRSRDPTPFSWKSTWSWIARIHQEFFTTGKSGKSTLIVGLCGIKILKRRNYTTLQILHLVTSCSRYHHDFWAMEITQSQ